MFTQLPCSREGKLGVGYPSTISWCFADWRFVSQLAFQVFPFSLVDGVHIVHGYMYMTVNYDCELAPGVRVLEFKTELCCLLVGLYKESCLFFLDSAFLSVKWKPQQNPFHRTIKSIIELIYLKNLAQCLGHCKFSFLEIKFVYIIENIFSLWHVLTFYFLFFCHGMDRENVEASLILALVYTNSFELYVLVFQFKQVLYMFKTQSTQCLL